jgi:ABC-type transport system substrate-binding protein
MQSFGTFKPKVALILGGVATGLLLLGMACGAAATATPPLTSAPTSGTPVVAAGPTPTAIPAPTTAPAEPVVHLGKVTIMIGNFGNERFDQVFNYGGDDYGRLIHAFLIASDVKDGKLVQIPGVATSWAISGDGLTWNLVVRKGVKFHNGTEVTAEDVVWSLRHSIGPGVGKYAIRGDTITAAKIVDRIEQTGPDQVSVTTKAPFPSFPNEVFESGPSWRGVFPKRATQHNVDEETAYDRNPVGAGIMKLVKHVPLESMTLERFPDYYHQPKNGFPSDLRMKFTQLDLKLAPEEATRAAALRAGEIDIAPVSLALRKQVEASGGRLVFGQEGTYLQGRQFGCWKPQFPCSDKRVRQALQYALDKELMRDKLYGGAEVMQIKGWGDVTPSTLGYSPELDPYPYDPAKARQLLADAGYPGGKGFGTLVIHTWSSRSTPFLPESAQLVADMWRRELGLDVEVRVGDEVILKTASDLSEEIHGQIIWRDNETRLDASGKLASTYGDPKLLNRVHNDPELFALAAKTSAVIDPVQREKALNAFYRRAWEEAHIINPGYINIPWGVGAPIATWEPYPLAIYISGLRTITLK